MQWFKPIKKKSAKTHRRKFGATHVSTVHEMVKFKQTKYLLKRLKLLMMLFLNKFNSSKKIVFILIIVIFKLLIGFLEGIGV
jgi:hypothetical protein